MLGPVGLKMGLDGLHMAQSGCPLVRPGVFEESTWDNVDLRVVALSLFSAASIIVPDRQVRDLQGGGRPKYCRYPSMNNLLEPKNTKNAQGKTECYW